jgi:hypothetical protein
MDSIGTRTISGTFTRIAMTNRKLKNFFYYAWDGRGFYGSIILAIVFTALCVGSARLHVDFVVRMYFVTAFLFLTVLCIFPLFLSRVPDPILFAWWDIQRIYCWIFGCRLVGGSGGGGMYIPDAECTRCRTRCGNIFRPLYERPYWKRKEINRGLSR